MPRNEAEAFKLMEIDNDGNLFPLFINKKDPLPLGKWMEAGCHPTKGFAVRPGWHCCSKIDAPHLKLRPQNGRRRIWAKVQIQSYRSEQRPESQGGVWYLAKRMRITGVLPDAVHQC